MYWWRITKYNPIYRNEHGWYTKNEWTDFSDINKTFSDGILTIEKYLSIENAYIDAIIKFQHSLGIPYLVIGSIFEFHLPKKGTFSWDLHYLTKKKEGDHLTGEELEGYVRLILRRHLTCKLKYASMMEVHFGHDYYMYIGSSKPCAEARFFIESSGLFIESFRSPYIEEYCDADDENNLLGV